MQYRFQSTPWEKIEVSEATANHLGLNISTSPYHVWSRMVKGIIHFVVLRTGETPLPDAVGWPSLPMALSTKGYHR